MTFQPLVTLDIHIFFEGLTTVNGEEEESDESGAMDKCHIQRGGSGGQKKPF